MKSFTRGLGEALLQKRSPEGNMECTLCPRECRADRAKRAGYCGATDQVIAARAALHYYEEPCISGTNGSGAVFFSHCALKCVFCQNREISSGGAGEVVSVVRLAEIYLDLQDQGAHNINLVTAGHYLPQVRESLVLAKRDGLKVPVVYNSSGYEKAESLKRLEGLVDVYLPDMKYCSDKYAVKYSAAPGYFGIAKSAIAEMFRQTGKCRFDRGGLIRRGVIVRHLMLPGLLFDSKKILDYLYETYGDSITISIMNQYTPGGNLAAFPELGKSVSETQYRALVDYAVRMGVTHAYVQEGGTVSESFIPQFDGLGVNK